MKEGIKFLDGEDFIGKTLVIEFLSMMPMVKKKWMIVHTYDFKVIEFMIILLI